MATRSKIKKSQPSRPTYYISYGFLFGSLNGAGFRTVMDRAGYTLSQRPETADIVIAHSAGCYRLPEKSAAKLVCFVGMPLVRTKTVRTYLVAERRNFAAFARQREHRRLLVRILLGCAFYALRHPSSNLEIIGLVRTAQARVEQHAQVVFIANRDDPWPHAPELDQYMETKPWSFIRLSGCHDNLWQDPDSYGAIIDHYAKQLLA